MNRRDSLKMLAIASGGLISLPAWARGWTPGNLGVITSQFTLAEENTLAAVADTIIPAGNSIGALSVGVDKFLQKLISDCYDKEVQENVKAQLAALEKSAQSAYGTSFGASDQAQRESMLIKLSNSGIKEEKDFFNLMKSETIRGFSTSKEVMVNYLKYKPAPGHYYGCVDVKA
jgi:hypothetical protein